MAIEAEALLALSEKATQGRMELQSYDPECPGVPMIAVPDDTPVGGTPTNGLVAVATLLPVEAPFGDFPGESSRAEANAQFIAALWSAYRDGSLIHRSSLAEDTARAAEEMRERCAAHLEEVAGWKEAGARGQLGSMFASQSAADLRIEANRLRALPLTKEDADANR